MFGNLFGSEKEDKIKELKSEIEEKKKRIENIEKNLEKEKKRAKEAITEKQKADKNLKKLENKLESLKDKVQRIQNEKDEVESLKQVKNLPRKKYSSFLSMMSTVELENEGLKTQYVTDKEKIESETAKTKLKNIDSKTGFVYLNDELGVFNCVLIPPLPIENSNHLGNKFKLKPLKKQLSNDLIMKFIDFHAGKSVIGSLKKGKFENFKSVKSNIKNQHSKGGFSQGRFERNRKKQIEEHIDKVIEKQDEYTENLDYILLSGNNRMISIFKDETTHKAPLIERNIDFQDVNRSKKDYLEKIFGAMLYIL